MIDNDADV